MNALLSVIYFLFSLAFNLFLFMLWARFILRYFRVSPLHPISRSINTILNPIIKPFNAIMRQSQQSSRFDWACLMVIMITELIKFSLLGVIVFMRLLPINMILLYSLADLIIQPCELLFYIILIQVIMSWVRPGWQHPLNDVMYRITQPLLAPVRRVIPAKGGLDFSPLMVLVILKVITIFIGALLPMRLLGT